MASADGIWTCTSRGRRRLLMGGDEQSPGSGKSLIFGRSCPIIDVHAGKIPICFVYTYSYPCLMVLSLLFSFFLMGSPNKTNKPQNRYTHIYIWPTRTSCVSVHENWHYRSEGCINPPQLDHMELGGCLLPEPDRVEFYMNECSDVEPADAVAIIKGSLPRLWPKSASHVPGSYRLTRSNSCRPIHVLLIG